MGVLPAKAQKNRYLSAKHCSNRAPATRIPLGTWVSGGGSSFEWGWGGLRARWSELRARWGELRAGRGEPRGQRNALTWWPFHLRAGGAELRWSGTGLRRPCAGLRAWVGLLPWSCAGLRAWVGLLPWSCAFLLCSAGSLLCFVAAVLCFEGSLAGFRAAGPSFVPAPGPFVSEAACLLPEGHCHSRRPALSWTTPAARTPATRIKNHPPRRRN